ncbi:MAG: hypothetical protein JWN65_3672 [Solirubrobacterales bacterium]|nr:hypothetical protein [Solirubrobacterales bacterium]
MLGHRNELPAGARTAVALGSASVLHDGTTRVVHGSDRLREALDDPTPQRSVIQPVSPSAVQSCLGDAAAETLLGAETLGAGTTLGVGLRSSQDAPTGLKLVV